MDRQYIITMDNFGEMMTHASHLKEFQLKKDRQVFESLPKFLQSGLNYSRKYASLRNQNFYVRLFVSDTLKQQGNDLVKTSRVEQALAKYEESLSVFRYISTKTRQDIKDSDLTYFSYQPSMDQLESMNKHLVSLYLNMSLCLTKLNRKNQSVKSVEEAIAIEDNNPKSYYRLGQAYLQYINRTEQDIEAGLNHLGNAYKLSNNPEILKEISKIKRQVWEDNDKNKKAFSFMINALTDSTHSQKNAARDKLEIEPRKETSRSLERKRIVKTANPKIQVRKSSLNNASEQNKNLLVEKQLKSIQEKEQQKRQNTHDRLLRMSNKSDWEEKLLQNFITSKGGKILTLMDFYGYKQYLPDYKQLLRRCMVLCKKTDKTKENFVSEDGEAYTIDFEDGQTKRIVGEQKLIIYQEMVSWLNSHPMPQIRKYTQRLENQRAFIQEKVRERKHQSQKVNSVMDNMREKSHSSSLKMFYVGALVLLLWALYNNFK